MMYAVMSVPSSLAFHQVNSITLVANAHNEEQGSKRRVIEICAGGQEDPAALGSRHEDLLDDHVMAARPG